jgi:hypothetical protein
MKIMLLYLSIFIKTVFIIYTNISKGKQIGKKPTNHVAVTDRVFPFSDFDTIAGDNDMMCQCG